MLELFRGEELTDGKKYLMFRHFHAFYYKELGDPEALQKVMWSFSRQYKLESQGSLKHSPLLFAAIKIRAAL